MLQAPRRAEPQPESAPLSISCSDPEPNLHGYDFVEVGVFVTATDVDVCGTIAMELIDGEWQKRGDVWCRHLSRAIDALDYSCPDIQNKIIEAAREACHASC